MGKKPSKTNSLTREEEKILWQTGQLGDRTPRSIISTLWWQLTQHFGLRGRQEHHSMRVEDFTFRKDESGTSYIVFSEGITKTRQSGLHQKNRLQVPKILETKSDRCPVKIFRKYLSKRPVELRNSGPFYLQPIVNPLTEIWYKKQPMGINNINGIMKDMIANSPLRNTEKHLANHSARKTLVKKLKQHQIPKSDIITITGHNREAGLDAYDSGDEVQQKQLSHVIDNHRIAPKRKLAIPPSDPSIQNPPFSFFPNGDIFKQQISATNPYSFNNCTVHFHMNNQVQNVSSSVDNPRKRRRIIYSSDLSPEK